MPKYRMEYLSDTLFYLFSTFRNSDGETGNRLNVHLSFDKHLFAVAFKGANLSSL